LVEGKVGAKFIIRKIRIGSWRSCDLVRSALWEFLVEEGALENGWYGWSVIFGCFNRWSSVFYFVWPGSYYDQITGILVLGHPGTFADYWKQFDIEIVGFCTQFYWWPFLSIGCAAREEFDCC